MSRGQEESKVLRPMVALALGLNIFRASDGKAVRGQLGMFTLRDVQRTVDGAEKEIASLQAALKAVSAAHPQDKLIAELGLRDDELTAVLNAASQAFGLNFNQRVIVKAGEP